MVGVLVQVLVRNVVVLTCTMRRRREKKLSTMFVLLAVQVAVHLAMVDAACLVVHFERIHSERLRQRTAWSLRPRELCN